MPTRAGPTTLLLGTLLLASPRAWTNEPADTAALAARPAATPVARPAAAVADRPAAAPVAPPAAAAVDRDAPALADRPADAAVAGPFARWLARHAHPATSDPRPDVHTRLTATRTRSEPLDVEDDHVWTVQLDQDLFAPNNQDRDYTQGLSMGFYAMLPEGQDVDFGWPMGALHGWLDEQARALGLHHDEQAQVVEGRSGGALAYTPDEVERQTVSEDDRPYASLLYYSTHRIELTDRRAVGTELRVGVLGSTVAEVVQKYIHEVFRKVSGSRNPKEPNGWDLQISNGGELTALYRVTDKRVVAEERGAWDVAVLTDVNLGYQTSASAGLAVRSGRIANGIESLPFDAIGRANHVPARLEGDLYGWIAGRVRLVAYDVLLQGQFRDSDHTIHADEVSRAVVHLAMGATWNFAPGWQVGYSVNVRSRESTHPTRYHNWGGITLSGRY